MPIPYCFGYCDSVVLLREIMSWDRSLWGRLAGSNVYCAGTDQADSCPNPEPWEQRGLTLYTLASRLQKQKAKLNPHMAACDFIGYFISTVLCDLHHVSVLFFFSLWSLKIFFFIDTQYVQDTVVWIKLEQIACTLRPCISKIKYVLHIHILERKISRRKLPKYLQQLTTSSEVSNDPYLILYKFFFHLDFFIEHMLFLQLGEN
jgi:hypothetical protein